MKCIPGQTSTLQKKFKEYDVVHSPAENFSHLGRPSGGLVLLIKKSILNIIEFIDTGISHVQAIKISKEHLKSNKDILYINTYIHPAGSISYTNKEYQNTFDEIEQFLLDQMDINSETEIIIGGGSKRKNRRLGLSG